MEKEKLAEKVRNYYLGDKGKIFEIKNFRKKKDKEKIYELMGGIIKVVEKKIISPKNLEEFIKKNRNSLGAGLVASIRYIISTEGRDRVKAMTINRNEKYGFLVCKKEIDNYFKSRDLLKRSRQENLLKISLI